MHDLFSEANRAAATVRDLYEAFIRFGFTPDQAFVLVVTVLSAGTSLL